MQIGLLRRLDFWIGRPLCWLITVGYRIKRMLVPAAAPGPPERILLIKLFGLGSIVLALPTLAALRARFPTATIYFLTFAENRAVLTMTGQLPEAQIFTIHNERPALLLTSALATLWRLARLRIDLTIDLEFFSRFTAILAVLIRSRRLIGFYGFYTEGLKRGQFIDLPVNYNHTLHTARAFFTLLRPLGVAETAYNDQLPMILPRPGVAERLQHWSGLPPTPRRWVIIHPNSSDLIPLRNWPLPHFAALIRLLLDWDDTMGILITGGANDQASAAQLAHLVNRERVVNLAGRTTLRDLIDLFHHGDLLITVDSGPAHLAAMTPISGLILFGPETPALYAPLSPRLHCLYQGWDCQPCVTIYNSKHSHCTDNHCLRAITPEQVFTQAQKLLERPPAAKQP